MAKQYCYRDIFLGRCVALAELHGVLTISIPGHCQRSRVVITYKPRSV